MQSRRLLRRQRGLASWLLSTAMLSCVGALIAVLANSFLSLPDVRRPLSGGRSAPRTALPASGAPAEAADSGTQNRLASSAPAPTVTTVQSSILAPTLPSAPAAEPTDALASALERLPSTRKQFAALLEGANGGLVERVAGPDGTGSLEIAYTFDRDLSERVFGLLDRYHVEYGHVLISDARTGRLLVYASTDSDHFPPTRRYPAASLIKVVTAAATLRHAPAAWQRDCRFQGNPYRLTRARIKPPARGQTASFRRALAMSNNQCFAQLAVNTLGPRPLLEQIASFGWLSKPGPGHEAGRVTTASDDYELGLLGSGLAGTEITPLHAAQLGLVLASGKIREPYWIDSITSSDRQSIALQREPARAVLSPAETERLRELLIETTRTGTARRAFQRRGRALLAPVTVAGKTGSLSGKNPDGRYEWFVGVAPAERPEISIAVLTVHRGYWLRSSSQLAAEVLRQVFCPNGICSADAADRWLGDDGQHPS